MIELFIAFGAGLISFLSPCVLPLIPGYISYIAGTPLTDLTKKDEVGKDDGNSYCSGCLFLHLNS